MLFRSLPTRLLDGYVSEMYSGEGARLEDEDEDDDDADVEDDE